MMACKGVLILVINYQKVAFGGVGWGQPTVPVVSASHSTAKMATSCGTAGPQSAVRRRWAVRLSDLRVDTEAVSVAGEGIEVWDHFNRRHERAAHTYTAHMHPGLFLNDLNACMDFRPCGASYPPCSAAWCVRRIA